MSLDGWTARGPADGLWLSPRVDEDEEGEEGVSVTPAESANPIKQLISWWRSSTFITGTPSTTTTISHMLRGGEVYEDISCNTFPAAAQEEERNGSSSSCCRWFTAQLPLRRRVVYFLLVLHSIPTTSACRLVISHVAPCPRTSWRSFWWRQSKNGSCELL